MRTGSYLDPGSLLLLLLLSMLVVLIVLPRL